MLNRYKIPSAAGGKPIHRNMVQLTRLFFSLCLVSVSFATPAKRTVAQVEADITSIGNQVKTLDTDLTGFPASGLAGALVCTCCVFPLRSLTTPFSSPGHPHRRKQPGNHSEYGHNRC